MTSISARNPIGVVTLLLAGFSTPAASGPIQGDAITGIAKDRLGEPWAGAEVVLVSYPIPSLPCAGKIHRVTTTTDGQGRFSVRLAAGRLYQVWAHKPAEGPLCGVSDLIGPLIPGASIELTERGCTRAALPLVFENLEGWESHAPFHLCLAGLEAELDARAGVDLPPLPESLWRFTLLGNNGYPVHHGTLDLRGKVEQEALGIRVPAPVAVTLRIQDQRQAAVKRAEVLVKLSSDWSTIWTEAARSDTDGYARFDIAADANDYGYLVSPPEILVRAEACADRLVTLAGLPLDDVATAKTGKRQLAELPVRLAAGVSLRGRLLLDDERPLALVPLLLESCADSGEELSYSSFIRSVVMTGSDGRFDIPGRLTCSSAEYHLRLSAILSPELATELPQLHGAGVWPQAMLFMGPDAQPQSDIDLGTIRLGDLLLLAVDVRLPEGRPAAACELLLLEAGPLADSSGRALLEPLRPRTDIQGRLRMLLPVDGDMAFFARTHAALALGASVRSGSTIQLRDDHSISGKVVNHTGEPLAEATVYISSCQPLERQETGSTGDLHSLLQRFDPNLETRTDECGAFRLVVPCPARYVVRATWQRKGQAFRRRSRSEVGDEYQNKIEVAVAHGEVEEHVIPLDTRTEAERFVLPPAVRQEDDAVVRVLVVSREEGKPLEGVRVMIEERDPQELRIMEEMWGSSASTMERLLAFQMRWRRREAPPARAGEVLTTRVDGRAQFFVRPDTPCILYACSADVTGGAAYARIPALTAGQEHEVRVELPTACDLRIYGKVVGAGGEPVARARVTCFEPGASAGIGIYYTTDPDSVAAIFDDRVIATADTRDDGTFECEVPSWKNLDIRIEADGFSPALSDASPNCNTAERAAIVRLYRPARATVQVLDERGPAPRLTVRLTTQSRDLSQQPPEEREIGGIRFMAPVTDGWGEITWEAMTEKTGRCEFYDLTAGVPIAVALSRGSQAIQHKATELLLLPQEQSEVVLWAGQPISLCGLLLDQQGRPVAGQEIWLVASRRLHRRYLVFEDFDRTTLCARDADHKLRIAKSNDEGRFTFANVPPGPFFARPCSSSQGCPS
ncbi:MAG: carboxypeptidase-like regulatory domain-containing protein [Planctomycetota bacterium]